MVAASIFSLWQGLRFSFLPLTLVDHSPGLCNAWK